MDSSLYSSSWPPSIPEQQQHAQHEQRAQPTSIVDDWAKDRSNPIPQSGSVASPPMASPTIDMSDFTLGGDFSGSANSSILSASPQSFYGQYGYFMQSPYNTMAYGSPWPAPAPVPVSNYSTLNGATTSSSSSSSTQSQQQPAQQPLQQSPITQQSPHPATTNHMIIDPVLTLNGSASNGIQSSFNSLPHQTSPQQLQPQPSQQPLQPQRQYSYTPSHLLSYPSHYYRQQPQPSPQGTLSPQVLLSPQNSMMHTIAPSAFFSQPTPSSAQGQQQQPTTAPGISQSQVPAPAPAPTLSPEEREERKQQFKTSIHALLQPTSFSGAQAVYQLTERIANYGTAEVDAQTRAEILARIRDGAGNHYYRAWSENPTAIDITREWIKAAAKSDDPLLVDTVMPLLHLIDRLPLTVISLTNSKLGRIIKKLVKDEPSPAIKDMASNLERRWRNMISNVEGSSKAPESKGNEDSKSKKRKLSEPTQSKPLVPQKKAAVGTVTSTKPVVVKKETKPVAAVKDAKADFSFFSAPKAKAKLPSFKKAAVPAQLKKDEGNVALPSSFDPFQEALKSMKARKDSPALSTPPAASASTPPQAGLGKNGRKKKCVTWAADGQLVSIRLIERAIYDDDPVDGSHISSHNIRDLDQEEGAALHARLFEETVDWSEPNLVEMPPDPESRPPRGSESTEKLTQEQREQTALGAVYMTPNQIPESPAEPTAVITEEEVDRDVTTMTTGPEVDAIFWSGEPAPVMASVADLVGQLAMGNMMDPSMIGTAPNTQGLDLSAIVQNLPQEQLQQLLQQLSVPAGPFGQVSQYGGDESWSSVPSQSLAEYGQTYHEDSDQMRWSSESRGRGGRGRGRGRGGRGEDGYRQIRRKPCSFFAAGRCKYGDQCDFAHDLLALENP